MKIMLVGGAVRDILLGRESADKDYLVLDADRETFLKKYPQAREVGSDFPVFLVDGSEYAFPRAGCAASLLSDLLVRDLTINAFARDTDGTIHAHPSAESDLRDKILRPCSDHSFTDDPLRVFRAARFAARFPDFSPAPELLESMKSIAGKGLLDSLHAERVGMEARKAMETAAPGRFLKILADTDCLVPWFREFIPAMNRPAGPPKYHDKDVLGHTMEVMDRLAAAGASPLAVWGGLCHDLGKTLTPEEDLPRHIGHDRRGVEPVLELAQRLRLPNRWAEAGTIAAELHIKAGKYPELRPGTRVDLLMKLHTKNLVSEIFALAEADGHGNHLDEAEADLAALLRVQLRPQDRDQGPKSGEILRSLRAEAVAARRKS